VPQRGLANHSLGALNGVVSGERIVPPKNICEDTPIVAQAENVTLFPIALVFGVFSYGAPVWSNMLNMSKLFNCLAN